MSGTREADIDGTGRGRFPIVILTGLSGAGKSTALRVFEDMRFSCVDGLPAGLVPKLVALYRGQPGLGGTRGLALGMDLRQPDFLDAWNQSVEELKSAGDEILIIFLEARPQALFRRYATTRRPHPLESLDLGLEQALEVERKLLMPIRNQSDLVLDTSEYSIHDLRRKLQEKWSGLEGKDGSMRLHVISFGYKHGSPSEADLVFDLRFLPNPYFDPVLNPLTGQEASVADYVLKSEIGTGFLQRFLDFILYLLPLYAQEGRYRLTIALGCTGGRHRSVAVAEALAAAIKDRGYVTTLEHRHAHLD